MFIIYLFFILFLKVLKVRRPGRKTSGFRTVWILKICRTSGPDVMSGRALVRIDNLIPLKLTFIKIPIFKNFVCVLQTMLLSCDF